jgi:apolipoprotein D and lipocalin family protein
MDMVAKCIYARVFIPANSRIVIPTAENGTLRLGRYHLNGSTVSRNLPIQNLSRLPRAAFRHRRLKPFACMKKPRDIVTRLPSRHSVNGSRTAFFVHIALLVGRLANFFLQFSCILLDIAGHLLAGVAGDLSDNLFHGTLDFMLGAFSAILVHADSPKVWPAALQAPSFIHLERLAKHDFGVRFALTSLKRSDARLPSFTLCRQQRCNPLPIAREDCPMFLPAWMSPLSITARSSAAPAQPNEPVRTLDLRRYAGQWHEIAHLPMLFERRHVDTITAIESLHADGEKVAVRPGALKVRFAPAWLAWLPWIWADYWVIEIDPDYRWAIVGGPSRKYMWVLSRSSTMDRRLFARIREDAQRRGYPVDRLVIAAPLY